MDPCFRDVSIIYRRTATKRWYNIWSIRLYRWTYFFTWVGHCSKSISLLYLSLVFISNVVISTLFSTLFPPQLFSIRCCKTICVEGLGWVFMARNFVQNMSEEKFYDNLTIFDHRYCKTKRKASCHFSGQDVIYFYNFWFTFIITQNLPDFVAQVNKVFPKHVRFYKGNINILT